MSDGEEDSLDMVTTNSQGTDLRLPAKVFPLCLESFLISSKFSDLTIKVDDCEFKVHKIVLCGQSEYFDRLLSREWKETTDNAITLEEDDPRAIEAMIHFMYGLSYDSSGNSQSRLSPMLFNVEVFRVADKYGVAALKKLSKARFDVTAETCWDMDDFPHLITDVYGSLPCQEHRDTIAQVSFEHLEVLLKKDNFLRVLKEVGGFAADLVERMADGREAQCEYKCPSCHHVWGGTLTPGTSYYCPSCGSRRSDWSSFAVGRK